ncbi:NIL domain-containing protein [Chloroflexota bacterium]
MAKRRVMFTLSSEVIAEPIIYTLGQQFRLITNIRRADLTEDRGYIILDLDGKEDDITAGIAWATSKGVRVTSINNTEQGN